jgi:hypothetical protein
MVNGQINPKFPRNGFLYSLANTYIHIVLCTTKSTVFVPLDNYTANFPPLAPGGIRIASVHIQDEEHQPKSNVDFLRNIKMMFPAGGEMTIDTPSYLNMVVQTGYAPVFLPSQGGRGQEIAVGRLDDPRLQNGLSAEPNVPNDEEALIRYLQGPLA